MDVSIWALALALATLKTLGVVNVSFHLAWENLRLTMKELHEKLEIAELYAKLHTADAGAQQCYATRYNTRSRDKHFNVNDRQLLLKLDHPSATLLN